LHVNLTELKPSRATVNNNAYAFAVAFAEERYREFFS